MRFTWPLSSTPLLLLLTSCLGTQNFHVSRDSLQNIALNVTTPKNNVTASTSGYNIDGTCSPVGAPITLASDDMTPTQVTCECKTDSTYRCGEVGFPGTGPNGTNPVLRGEIQDTLGRTQTFSRTLAIVTPSVTMTRPSYVISAQSFTPTGTCLGDQATVSVDIGADSTATTGVSQDPVSCSCIDDALSCPSVTITYPTFTTDQVSLKGSLTAIGGATASHTTSSPSPLLHLSMNSSLSINDNHALDVTGVCSPNGATIVITPPSGFSPTSKTCTCLSHNLDDCGDLTESSATINTTLSVSGSLASGGATIQSARALSVINSAPVALSGSSGVGYAYQAGQLGGLSFNRYGHSNPTSANRVGHIELADFVDDPLGNADGVRADSTAVASGRSYAGYSGDEGDIGWAESTSEADDKYADGSGRITPVSGSDSFGDTYRGYFVPPSDGIYNFVNLVSPDNSVRLLMAPNECPHRAIAVFSADWSANQGAVHPNSIWISGNGGSYDGTKIYNHLTTSFFPGGSSDANYANGDVYLLANKIYYLEIRYGEGGGSNAFSFGYQRRDIAVGSTKDATAYFPASSMLPYLGTDKYVPRQGCKGAYLAAPLFTDSDSDTLTYSARLVNADGSAISGTAAQVSHIGLSFNTTTGELSGTLNGNYVDQKIVFGARDTSGSNTFVEASAVSMIP